jgi:hypothetical protein
MTEFSDNGNAESESHWHVNRGIPVVWLVGSVFIGIAQFGGFVWYASQFNTRVDVVEKTVALIAPQGERLTRVEESLKGVKEGIGDLKIDMKTLLTQAKAR